MQMQSPGPRPFLYIRKYFEIYFEYILYKLEKGSFMGLLKSEDRDFTFFADEAYVHWTSKEWASLEKIWNIEKKREEAFDVA